jgi:Protein of unknown function DUF262/HNH endonuclease
MKIELKEITIRQVVEGYQDSQEEGVVGFGGKLNIRPKYQREFIYKDRQRDAVIETARKNFPLNVMYWVKNSDESYEVLDGQQRIISICQYVVGDFSIITDGKPMYSHTFTIDEQEQILDYKLMVYFCEGTDKEKLDWFKTINIAGEKLTDQELRNAIYTGTWLSDAKRYFSKTGCAAYGLASTYMDGEPIRQKYLETAIDWISNGQVESYMATHQHNPNANELWLYFQRVINWITVTFPIYRREMKGIEWGVLHNEFENKPQDSKKLEVEIATLMQDEDVSAKKGIYSYVLTRNEKHLNIRAFTDKQKREAYERQKGLCPKCTKPNNRYKLEDMEADHITPWHEGGKTAPDNCQMLCKMHNRAKSGK